MISKLLNRFIILILTLSSSMAQDTGSNEGEDVGGREMFTMVDVSYSQEKGNIDFLSLYYGFNFSIIGNVGPFMDTEFSFDFSRSDDRLDGESFSDDQYITSQFDLWANQRISPFLFFQKSYDNSIGLQNRMNAGIGAKVGLFKGFSISYAFLSESEDYEPFFGNTDSIAFDYYNYTDSTWWGEYDYTMTEFDDYYYYDYEIDTTINGVAYVYTDSSLVYADYYYTDSTLAGQYHVVTDSVNLGGEQKFWRHSIRPKIKFKLFDNNVVFDYRFYFKPKTDDWEDFLLENELTISIATFYEAMTIDFSYTNKYNSRYDPARNKK